MFCLGLFVLNYSFVAGYFGRFYDSKPLFLKSLTLFANKPATIRDRSPYNTVKNYFDCWNNREMDAAIANFNEGCVYEDTLYPNVFNGKEELKRHLYNVADSLPDSFKFVIDHYSEDKKTGNVGIQWHVENDGKPLPFTRGCSMYTVDSNGFITKGFDVPEPTLKSGSLSLGLLKLAKNFISDPIRIIPTIAWLFYVWYLFLSNIAPGVNALALDPATWIEVKNLSINFWLILPIFSPQYAPLLHPILEGIFNFVLVYAALFVGFIIDGKTTQRENQNEMLFTVIVMQFLTNAVYLPYLINRTSERDKNQSRIYSKSLSKIEEIGESKITPIILCGLGVTCLYWCVSGRYDDYGDWSTRLSSYVDLVSNDRLSFSFLIDIIYFALFQGWLIDDDLLRRENVSDSKQFQLKLLGKFVPFFGFIYYLLSRPALKSQQ
jgi:hypothetical protein